MTKSCPARRPRDAAHGHGDRDKARAYRGISAASCGGLAGGAGADCGLAYRNYTIFLREPENLLFGYWEYHGIDFEADAAEIAADPVTQDWWRLCGPCQDPLESRADDEWWAMMEEVFHTDLPKEETDGQA